MIEVEQFALAFDDPVAARELALRDQWARNQAAQATFWGPDQYVILWVCQGTFDREWWDGLHEYQRHTWRMRYEVARDRANTHGCRMIEPGYAVAMEEEEYRHSRQLAESWAVDLRQAFLEGKPCPIKPVPGLLGTEWILRWAFDLAAVPAASLGGIQPADLDELQQRRAA